MPLHDFCVSPSIKCDMNALTHSVLSAVGGVVIVVCLLHLLLSLLVLLCTTRINADNAVCHTSGASCVGDADGKAAASQQAVATHPAAPSGATNRRAVASGSSRSPSKAQSQGSSKLSACLILLCCTAATSELVLQTRYVFGGPLRK